MAALSRPRTRANADPIDHVLQAVCRSPERRRAHFYSDQTHAFGDDSVEIGGVFASYSALALTTLRRDEQGILVERFNIDPSAAFELLKRLSQESNTPLVEIARRVVHSEGRPR